MNRETFILTDVSARLSYDLKLYRTADERIFTLFDVDRNVDVSMLDNTNRLISGNLIACQPIYFPLSCITESIQFRGEELIPIVELAKIATGLNDWFMNDGKCVRTNEYRIFDEFWYCPENGFRYRINTKIICDKFCQRLKFEYGNIDKQYKLFEWFNEHMIDYRGLIEKEMAKDVSTLIENPYASSIK